jgi:hypothetical protein
MGEQSSTVVRWDGRAPESATAAAAAVDVDTFVAQVRAGGLIEVHGAAGIDLTPGLLHVAGRLQRDGIRSGFVDADLGVRPDMLRDTGVDPLHLLVVQPLPQRVPDVVRDLLDSAGLTVVFVDVFAVTDPALVTDAVGQIREIAGKLRPGTAIVLAHAGESTP